MSFMPTTACTLCRRLLTSRTASDKLQCSTIRWLQSSARNQKLSRSRKQSRLVETAMKRRQPKERSPQFSETEKDFIVARSISTLWRPFAFTAGVCGISYIGAVVAKFEADSKRARFYFDQFQAKRGQYRNWFHEQWNWLTPGAQLLAALIGTNVLVFTAWHFVPLQPFMARYFMNGFYMKSLCLPMFLSAFSHYNVLHLGLNMYVLYSFGGPVIDKFFGVEQFTGFYCSAAVVSSLAGICHKATKKTPIAALGASGAILAVLSYTCVRVPDAQLHIIFLPFFTFSTGTALIAIVGLDVVGLLMGWRMFDHACHLGGSLFGIWYASYGQPWLWSPTMRMNIERRWLEYKRRNQKD